MPTIYLTQNKETILDSDDFDHFSKFNWYYAKTTGDYGGYAKRRKGKKFVSLHREILNVVDSKLIVDHINGNRLDNRRCNLRITTAQINARNVSSSKTSTSKYIGVCLKSEYKYKKWQARIKINGKEIHLGYFLTEFEAALARKDYILRHYLEGFRIDI